MSMCSCAVHVTIFSNGSIILLGFKFTELHTLTLATRSYTLLVDTMDTNFTSCLLLCCDYICYALYETVA